jgi:ribonuclease R
LGDVVDVRLVEAQPIAGALRFELLSEATDAPRGGLRECEGRSVRRAEDNARTADRKKPAESKGRKSKSNKSKGSKSKRKSADRKSKTSGKSKRGKSWKP